MSSRVDSREYLSKCLQMSCRYQTSRVFNSTAPKIRGRIHKSSIFVFFPSQLSSLDYVS